MTIKEALVWAKKELEFKNVEGPKASAEFLLRQVLGVDNTYLFTHPEKSLTLTEGRKYKKWVKRRSKHEPVWYITGKIEFFGQDLVVNNDVLIPRPETEILIELILKRITKNNKPKAIVDIGTGSGAIILSLAHSFSCHPDREKRVEGSLDKLRDDTCCFFASDFSEKALKVAKKNAKNLFSCHSRHSTLREEPSGSDSKSEGGNLVTFRKGDLFGPWVGQKFDIIVANLPYVPHEDMPTLAYDLIHYEPRLALDGGVQGLEIYERFFKELPDFVNPGAMIYCEIGDKQGDALEKMAKKIFPTAKVEVVKDYADFERIVIVEIPA